MAHNGWPRSTICKWASPKMINKATQACSIVLAVVSRRSGNASRRGNASRSTSIAEHQVWLPVSLARSRPFRSWQHTCLLGWLRCRKPDRISNSCFLSDGVRRCLCKRVDVVVCLWEDALQWTSVPLWLPRQCSLLYYWVSCYHKRSVYVKDMYLWKWWGCEQHNPQHFLWMGLSFDVCEMAAILMPLTWQARQTWGDPQHIMTIFKPEFPDSD